MRVLHVIPSVSALRGGPSVAVVAMAREIRTLGIDCDVLTTDDDGPGRMDAVCGGWREHGGARVWFLPRWTPSGPRALREFAVGRGLDAWLDARMAGYDILHVHALFSHLPSRTMTRARRAGRPYILRPLGLLEDYSLRRSRWKKLLALAAADRANVRRAAAIHWTSDRERVVSTIARGCPGWVVPLGVDAPVLPSAREAREIPTILFLSRWAPKKRIDLLLDALANLRDRPWRLVLAGSADDGRFGERVREWVAGCGFADRVELPGFLDGERKAAALARADMFVLPSESENFGIAVAEAMAWGLACVVTPGVALADDIAAAGAGWVAGGADTPGNLAGAIAEALADPAECRNRGARAAGYARENLGWRACARKLLARYSEIHAKGNVA